jgi:UTP--glucose-1-phosphate uridylyltransferase
MVEKPKFADAPSKQAIIGRYVLTPRVFELLEQTTPGAGGEIQLTDGILDLLKEQKVFGYTFEGKRYDAGDKFGMLQATVEFALKRADLGPKFREYLKGLAL